MHTSQPVEVGASGFEELERRKNDAQAALDCTESRCCTLNALHLTYDCAFSLLCASSMRHVGAAPKQRLHHTAWCPLQQLNLRIVTMESTAPECTLLKHQYEACFNDWFQKFLKGETRVLDECQELFKSYQNCLKPKLERDLPEQ